MSEQSEHRHALLSQAGRIRVYLRTLAARVDELDRERGETFDLLRDEKAALVAIMDEVDAMDGKEPVPSPEPVETSKPCKVCGEPKDLEDFQRHPTSRDGRVKVCRTCISARREKATLPEAS